MPDVIFERIASGTYTLGFVLRIPAGKLDPQTTLTEGATYLDCDLSGLDKPYLNEGFNAFVLAGPPEPTESQDEADPTPWVALTFLKPSDSGPSRAGKTRTPADPQPPQQFVLAKVVARTSQIVPYGTDPVTTSGTIESQVEPLDAARARRTTDALDSHTESVLHASPVDPQTGIAQDETIEAVAAGTLGSDVNSSGVYSEVEEYNAVWSIKRTKKIAGLPIGYANRETYTDSGACYWPRVLLDIPQKSISPGADWDYQNLKTLAAPNYRSPYSGNTKVTVEVWWQKAAPTVTDFPELATADLVEHEVRIHGAKNSPDILPCLHPAFTFAEDDWVPDGIGGGLFQTVTFAVGATAVQDWPATQVKMKVTRQQGGYACERRTFHKPAGLSDPVTTIS